MSILPAIPVLLLGLVTVWFLWPMIVDPLRKRPEAPRVVDENDTLAEKYFERWKNTSSLGNLRQS